MRRWILLPTLGLAALILAAGATGDPGKGKGKRSGHAKYTATIAVEDHGSCGNTWAADTSKRTWSVKPNKDGTFRVARRDRGTFVTLAGPSPGKCDPSGRHGNAVNAGIHGKFHGYLAGTVSGGTFNPNATCTAACVGDTTVFIATVFGAGARYTCLEGYAGCKFNFEYASHDKTLSFHHWQDKGTNGVSEQFTGDIANA